MSKNPSGVGPNSHADQTTALIVNTAAITSHLVDVRSLEHFLSVGALMQFTQTSSNDLLGIISSTRLGWERLINLWDCEPLSATHRVRECLTRPSVSDETWILSA